MILFSDLHGNRECLDLLRQHAIPCTLGNHEVDLLKHYHLPEELLAFIRTWPLTVENADGYFTHTLTEETSFGPHFQRVHHDHQAKELVARAQGAPVFIGHTHLPGWWENYRWHPVYAEDEVTLKPGQSYVINLGSLGEPGRPQHPRYSDAHKARHYSMPRMPLPDWRPSAGRAASHRLAALRGMGRPHGALAPVSRSERRVTAEGRR